MLDAETKRKIDNARDILVGKVPDPKSQVDQITIALIYKFMDDIDQEAEELGGKTKFFTGEFEKYAWSKLMDSKLGGRERLDLYAEGIQKMNQNKNIPQLFRDIFKDAFLPYRDPETLNLFLKEINGFTYDHSERLGDAFEYLLSVMASQGKAGQFRTPRHIIEFIVDVVDPDKDDTILDPSCGTAGFLISAYKHILEKHTKEKLGDKLTPDQRERLTRNFVGYDISPDMVRLSLVNMYLHKFPNPQIYEYDTLTSEERWPDRFDAIMANPPFMTPKGGIRPHKRFAIQANRSELLFVDYIAEHLRPNGRAGVIVPEGIIFQSSNAYKSLRKMLVEDGYLWAVVSLPAGVFNPYSGVKTSILFLDKVLAKQAKSILFVTIENDGFDLGAQRRAIDENDLPQALDILKKYEELSLGGRRIGAGIFAPPSVGNVDVILSEAKNLIHLVSKEKIATSGDYNLSGERYKEITSTGPKKWPMVELGDVLDYEQPTNYIVSSEDYNDEYEVPVLTAGKSFILGYTNEEKGVFKDNLPVIIFDDFTTATKLVDFPFKVKSSAMKILKAKKGLADALFVYYMMQKIRFDASRHKRYWISQYSKIKIPLPPLEVQKQIVEELDGYQKIIDGAKQVVTNYKPTIKIDPEWETAALGSLIETITPPKKVKSSTFKSTGKYPIIDQSQENISGWSDDASALVNIKQPVVIFGDHTCAIKYSETLFIQGADGIKILNTYEELLPKFLFLFLKANPLNSSGYKRHFSKLKVRLIPVPPLKTQKQIAARIEAEQKLVNANKELIKVFEQKIKDKIVEVWGK